VKTYLERTEKRCPGDFAIVPNSSSGPDSQRIESYEIACIGEDVSASASLLFFSEGEMLNVIAHEAEAKKMAAAMDKRDRLLSALKGS